MDTAFLEMKKLVDVIHPLSTAEWSSFSEIWSPFSAKRKEVLTVTGSKEKYLYFVIEGVQRVYYYDDHGREATIVFTYAPSFGGVIDALLLQQPSKYFYETLTPSKFLRTPYSELDRIMKQLPAVETLLRKGMTGIISGLLERMSELQCYSSEAKFRSLVKRSPHILQLVPHKYLANYLGIDPTNFSKLINSIRL